MLTDKTVVGGGEIGKGDRLEKSVLLGDEVALGNQRVTCSVERGQEVHLSVAMLEGKVAGDKG